MGGVLNVILQPFFAEKNYILFGKWSNSQWHLVEFADTNFVLQFVFLKAKSTFVARGSLSFWLVTCNFRKRRLYGYLSQIGIMFRQFDLVLRKNVMPWFFDMAEVKIPRKIEKTFMVSKFTIFSVRCQGVMQMTTFILPRCEYWTMFWWAAEGVNREKNLLDSSKSRSRIGSSFRFSLLLSSRTDPLAPRPKGRKPKVAASFVSGQLRCCLSKNYQLFVYNWGGGFGQLSSASSQRSLVTLFGVCYTVWHRVTPVVTVL